MISDFIVSIFIGGLSGWFAGQLYKGDGFGVPKNVVLGISGSLIGEFLLWIIGIQYDNFFFKVFAATGGAVLILFIVKKIKS